MFYYLFWMRHINQPSHMPAENMEMRGNGVSMYSTSG